jgi:hypothetical protein
LQLAWQDSNEQVANKGVPGIVQSKGRMTLDLS